MGGLGRASAPAAGQTQLGQNAALGGTSWRPARGHAAVHIKLKDAEKRSWVPKGVLGKPFGGSTSIPTAIDLFLLAPDSSRQLCTVVRPRSVDGLQIPAPARAAMQQAPLKQASSPATLLLQLKKRQRPASCNVLALQRMECDGVLSPNALGVGLLTGDVSPEIKAEAEYHADANLMRQCEGNSSQAKRPRLTQSAEPAATGAATWLTLGGSTCAAAAAVPCSNESAAASAAAEQLQQREQLSARPKLPPDPSSPQPAAQQQLQQPAVAVAQATAGMTTLHQLLAC